VTGNIENRLSRSASTADFSERMCPRWYLYYFQLFFISWDLQTLLTNLW